MSTPREIRAIARNERASKLFTKAAVQKDGASDKKLRGPRTRLHARNTDASPEGESPAIIAPSMNEGQHASAQNSIASEKADETKDQLRSRGFQGPNNRTDTCILTFTIVAAIVFLILCYTQMKESPKPNQMGCSKENCRDIPVPKVTRIKWP